MVAWGCLEGVILKGHGQKHEKAACVWTHKSEHGVCGEENICIRGSTQQADRWEDSASRSPTAPIIALLARPPSLHCLHSPPHRIACTAPLIALLAQWAHEWRTHAAEVEATHGPNSKGCFSPSLRVTVFPDA